MVEDYRLLQLCFQSCATSLHFSQAHRDGKSLLDERNNREADTLRSMVRLTVLHPLTADQTGVSLIVTLRIVCVRYLENVLPHTV